MKSNPRKIAYRLLEEWEQKKTFPNLALKNALRNIGEERDRRFITALVYGVVERKITLDHFINQCLSTKKIETSVRCVLRMGIYQMFYMSIPASAACNTSVELIKERGLTRSAALVNAVLRRCDREREELMALKKADFSLRYSIDPQLVELLLEQYGKETFVSMMEGMKKPETAIYLFHNIKKLNAESFLQQMNQEGIALEPTEFPHLYRASVGFSPEHSKAYQDGFYHIVGHHSAQAALLMPEGAKKVMDLCAAPGGKTMILATIGKATVHSFDLHEHKVSLLQKEAKRLAHQNIIVSQQDGTQALPEHLETADFVLCDVPCSGLGMMGKKPDIKYKNYNSEEFTSVQTAILSNGASYLKRGGRLVYSTCTVDHRENEQLITCFLQSHPEFSLDQSVLDRGEKLYLPLNGGDGFYIAVLKKD